MKCATEKTLERTSREVLYFSSTAQNTAASRRRYLYGKRFDVKAKAGRSFVINPIQN